MDNLLNVTSDVIAEEHEGEQSHVTMGFVGNAPGEVTVRNPNDDIRDDSTSLDKFLSRPVKIVTITSDVASATYYPLELFLNNPAVISKLKNVKGLTGTLCVRIQQSAMPYNYGLDLWVLRPEIVGQGSNVGYDATTLVSTTHCYMDASTDDPQVMKVPLIWQYPYINLRGDVDDRKLFRLIRFKPTNNYFNSSNFSVVTMPITVYCWLEDVQMVNTAPDNIVYQSAEYKGVVSAPATAVANVAAKLTDIPIIGKFAKATEIGAKAIAGVASLFGFSKPLNIEPPMAMYNQQNRNMFTSTSLDVANKLTLDVKQENSIDPYWLTGSTDDPLAFKNIVTRPALLHCAMSNHLQEWTTSGAPDDMLAEFPVSPGLCIMNTNQLIISPVGSVGMLFRYWMGTMKFRFRIAASQFHRGKLQFLWSPNKLIQPVTEDLTNLTEMCIMDIVNDKVIEIEIPYSSIEPCKRFQLQSFVGASPDDYYECCNGFLYMRVLEPLQAPISTATVYILSEIMGGDDMMFMVPTMNYLSILSTQDMTGQSPTPFVPQAFNGGWSQSANALYSPQDVSQLSYNYQSATYAPTAVARPVRKCVLGHNIIPLKNTIERQFGEVFVSFRPMIKAYQYIHNYTTITESGWMLPFVPRLNSMNADKTKYISRNGTWIAMLHDMFLCRRGGIRYKAIVIPWTTDEGVVDNPYTQWPLYAVRSRYPAGAGELINFEISTNSAPLSLIGQGTAMSEVESGPSLTVEIPYQLPYKYVTRAPPIGSASVNDTKYKVSYDGCLMFFNSYNNQRYADVRTYVAAAEDTTFDYYIGPPRYYFWTRTLHTI